MRKPLIILKLGTASVIREDGRIDKDLLTRTAAQCREISRNCRLVIVSSGAVGLGRLRMKGFNGRLEHRKAAAAVGNPLLMQYYSEAFEREGLQLAQTLCERGHFSDRDSFLRLRQTIETLWQEDFIPVANENDVVSDLELKFSDNDELATLLAIGLGAEALLFGTAVPGVMDPGGNVVREIPAFTEEVMSLATGDRSSFGLGGMVSKLTFARLATRLGIRVVIFGSRGEGAVLSALSGASGTVCHPKTSSPDARKKWLASGSIVSGRILVDAGAGRALAGRRSLLAVGVTAVASDFEKGEVVEVFVDGGKWPVCVARAKLSSADLRQQIGAANLEVAHADDIVLL